MLTDGLEWCGILVDYCDVFISCLDSHSDGTHSLQSIHCWDTDAMLHFSKSDEETNSSTSWMIWGWVNINQIFIFGWTISLNWRERMYISLLCRTESNWDLCWLCAQITFPLNSASESRERAQISLQTLHPHHKRLQEPHDYTVSSPYQ